MSFPQAQQVLPSRVRIRSLSMGDMVAYLDDDELVDAIPISRKLLLTKVMKTRDCPAPTSGDFYVWGAGAPGSPQPVN